ncbi:MAG: hypothetical protein WBG86_08865 [Polyangiales bacterium]
MRDLVFAMWLRCLCAFALMAGCKSSHEPSVELPNVKPDDVVVSWGMIGRGQARDTMYMAIHGNRNMVLVTKRPNGTMASVERMLPADQYAELVRNLRQLDCCSLSSAHETPPTPVESKPELGIDFGDMKCQVSLWDSEWREGRARECGFAVAAIHGRGFVPDPPSGQ